jgi:hypothetical protein
MGRVAYDLWSGSLMATRLRSLPGRGFQRDNHHKSKSVVLGARACRLMIPTTRKT